MDVERVADRPVALVAREEAVENLAAVPREPVERMVDVEGLVEPLDYLLCVGRLRLLHRLLAGLAAQAVDAEPPGQLAEPRSDRSVVAQTLEPLVRTGEDLLEHVFRVVLGQPEGLHRDRVHVAREALDELAPGLVLAGAAAGDESGVGGRFGHDRH